MYRLGILGTGKMGGAILEGVLRSKSFLPAELCVFDLDDKVLEKYAKMGVSSAKNPEELLKNSAIMLIALKPQNYDALSELSCVDCRKKAIISLAPGKKIELLESIFKGALIVRAMPNTPALVGCATVTLFSNAKGSSALMADIEKIFSSIGKYEFLKSEREIDLAIPLNGSMPAYLFSFVKEFVDSAVALGIDEDVAKRLCVNSIIGSCKLLENSNDSVDVLIKNVCSKGGTTIAGLDKLYENGFSRSVRECYNACSNRSIELGG